MDNEASPVERTAVRRGYDELEDAYVDTRSLSGPEQDLLDGYCRALPADALILDVGCGPGTPVLDFITDRITAVGIDLSRTQLQLASENAPGAGLAQGEMSRLPIATNAVDAVVAFHSIIHVPLSDHQQVIDEFARVLRPGGQLLMTEGPGEWTGSNPDWLDAGVEMQWEIAGAEATRAQLDAAGFVLVDEYDTEHELDDTDERWRYFHAEQPD